MDADIIAPESFRYRVRTALPDVFRENAKIHHFLMQNVQTDNDFW